MGDTEVVIHAKQVCERKLLELIEIENGAAFKAARKARATGAVLTDVHERVMATHAEIDAAHKVALDRVCGLCPVNVAVVAQGVPEAAVVAPGSSIARMTPSKRSRLAEEFLPVEAGFPSTGADITVDGKTVKTLECNRDRAEELGVHIMQALDVMPNDAELTELFATKPEVARRLQSAKVHLEGGKEHLRIQSKDLMVAHLAGGNWNAAKAYHGLASGLGLEPEEEKRIGKVLKLAEFSGKKSYSKGTGKKPFAKGGGGGSSYQGNNRDRYNGGGSNNNNNWDPRGGYANNGRNEFRNDGPPYMNNKGRKY